MNTSDNKNTIPCLETLSNELLLGVLSYLNNLDLFRALYNQNQRFQSLVYASSQDIIVSPDTTTSWFDQHISQIELYIKTVYLHCKFLRYFFAQTWSFPNLQVINLQGAEWSMRLKLHNRSPLVAIISSLNVLHAIDIRLGSFLPTILIRDYNEASTSLQCPFIECVSIVNHCERIAFVLSSRTPNLKHLKIDPQLSWDIDDDMNTLNWNRRTINLVTLNISGSGIPTFTVLEQLISSCSRTLRKLTFSIDRCERLDGRRLETTLKRCEQLQNLTFFFQGDYENLDLNEYRRSFQSEWWLDKSRPPIYFQHHDNNLIITSMPGQYQFAFQNDLDNWCFNKEDRQSSSVRFINISSIHFTNNIDQPITLEYLYLIHRIFTASEQSLSFDICHLDCAEILFEILMDDTSVPPVLPNVHRFATGLRQKLDSLALCVWILLMPNMEILDLRSLTTFNKIEVAKELKDMIDDDERLKPKFERINDLIIFDDSNNDDQWTKNDLVLAFQEVFPRATNESSKKRKYM